MGRGRCSSGKALWGLAAGASGASVGVTRVASMNWGGGDDASECCGGSFGG